MNTADKINLYVGAALIVLGIGGMWYFTRQLDKINKTHHVDREDLMNDVWSDLTKMPFYLNADAHEQTLYYDAFWNNKK